MLEPVIDLAVLGVVGLTPAIGIAAIRERDGRRWAADLTAYRLEFPGDLDLAGVERFLSGLSGLLPVSWKQPLVVRGIVLEVVASSGGIVHYILLPPSQDVVVSHLRGALPGVGLTLAAESEVPTPTLAGELTMSHRHHSLQTTDQAAVARAILASLQPLADGQVMVISLVLRPLGIRRPSQPSQWQPKQLTTPPAKQEPSKAVRDKYARPLFAVAIRLGVTSGSVQHDRRLLGRLTAAFHAANSPETTLRRRPGSSRGSAKRLISHAVPLVEWPCQLNVAELAGLVAWPPAGTSLPGLRTAGCRPLAPSSEIAIAGREVATSSFPGLEGRPLAVSVVGSLGHLHVIGPTGTGKSTLLLNLVVQDLEAGRGVVVVDAKSDLVADVLDRVPPHRADDVIVLDPTDDRPIGLNLLAGASQAPELAAEQLLSILHALYRASWGPRTDDILRACLLSLASRPGMTLAEVPLLLSDATFRRSIVGHLDDPIGLGPFWAWFNGLSDAEQTQVTGPVMNKLRAILVRPRLRHVLGQAEPLLDLDDVLASGKVLLVPLAQGALGADAARLLGALVIARLWQAAQRRVQLDPAARRPVMAYIDEFQEFTALPTPIPDLLAQARGLGLGLTLAHQHLGQLDTDVREAVIANSRSRVIFQTTSGDASRLAREVAPLGPSDLQGLGRHEVVVTLATAGLRVAPPATGRTRPAPPATGPAEDVRERSRRTYGRDREDIERELRRRHDRPAGPNPVGRQRRAS